MNRTRMIELIRDRLGFNKALSQEVILRHMDYVQSFYELGQDGMPAPWFMFKPTSFVKTEVLNPLVTLPVGFVSFDDDWPISIKTTDEIPSPLEMPTLEEFKELVAQGEVIGPPTKAILAGSFLHLFPIPDAVYKVIVPHYGRLGFLSENETSDWYTEFPHLIVEETSMSIMRATRDTEGLRLSELGLFRGDYIRRVEGRKHTLKDYYMGETS